MSPWQPDITLIGDNPHGIITASLSRRTVDTISRTFLFPVQRGVDSGGDGLLYSAFGILLNGCWLRPHGDEFGELVTNALRLRHSRPRTPTR